MKHSALQQAIRKQANSSCSMHVCRHKPAKWLQVTEQWGTLTDLLEIIDLKRNSGFTS
jgi:hypothetical protein